ncbi:MAG TPA: YdcF family protein [Longimicrobiales bacterium]|nr:YdcF family protein [Longimicrobiales bacterium]
MTGLRLLRFLGACVAAALVLWAGSLLLVLLAGALPSVRRADAILVLGAAQYNGRPSPVFKARLDHALELYHRGLAGHLIFTGGVGVGDTLSEGEVGRRYALAHGVPAEDVLVERQGVTSAESVGAAAALMHGHQLGSAIIVSDSYHMLRLELLGRRAGIHTYRAPAPDAPIDRVRRSRWRYLLRESVLFPATALLGGR